MPPPFDRRLALEAYRRTNPDAALSDDDRALLQRYASPADEAEVRARLGEPAGPPTAGAGDVLRAVVANEPTGAATRMAFDVAGGVLGDAYGAVADAPPTDQRPWYERAGTAVRQGVDRRIQGALPDNTRREPRNASGEVAPSDGQELLTDEFGDFQPPAAEQGGTLAAAQGGWVDGRPAVNIPGVGAVGVPEGADPLAFLHEAVTRWRATGTVSSTSFPPDIAARLAQMHAGQPGGGGGGEPRASATVGSQVRLPGVVDPATQALVDQSDANVAGHQQNLAAGSMAQAEAEIRARTGMGAAQVAAADQAAREAAEREGLLQERVGQLDQTLDRIRSREISVDHAFGGGAGRAAAVVAVALGELGRAMTGGDTNQALAVINAAVDRNLRAQEANLTNERTAGFMESQALGQMRSIFRDEQAARDAARAMALEGLAAQLGAGAQGFAGVNARTRQQLDGELRQQITAHRSRAAERERGVTTSTSLQIRGPQSSVLGNAAQMQGALGQVGRGQQAAAMGLGGPQEAGGETPASFPTGGRQGGSGGSRERSRQAAARALGRPDRAGLSSAASAFREQAEVPSMAPAGFTFTANQGNLQYTQTARTEGGLERIQQATAAYRDFEAASREINAFLSRNGTVFALDSVEDARAVSQAALEMGSYLRQMSGAQVSQGEADRYEALFAPLSGWANMTTQGLRNAWGAVQNQWRAMRPLLLTRRRNQLLDYGLTPEDSGRREQRAARAAAED